MHILVSLDSQLETLILLACDIKEEKLKKSSHNSTLIHAHNK